MDLLPAIDLLGGKVVRLARGEYDLSTTYSDDPAAVAGEIVSSGVSWLHVVDLDAARSGVSGNIDSIAAIRQVADSASGRRIKIQSGGGVRNRDAVERLIAVGVDRLVIGSAALDDWQWFESLLDDGCAGPGGLALGLDARDGKLAIHGWTKQSDVSALEIARRVSGSNLGAIVYTDIARDGMLRGVNIEATAEMVSATDIPVIASGGVAGIEDIIACRKINCGGVIVGKAWYDGRIDLAEALEVCS